jgi:hypothetical protein
MSKLKFEDTQYAKRGRRGRPPGAKNKVLILKDKDNRSENSDFSKTLEAWDRMEAEIPKPDWELIAKKQEERLTAYIAENEELAKICIMRWEEIQHLKYLVTYLEGRNEDSSV